MLKGVSEEAEEEGFSSSPMLMEGGEAKRQWGGFTV